MGKKWGPGIPGSDRQGFFDFGSLGTVEAKEFEDVERSSAIDPGRAPNDNPSDGHAVPEVRHGKPISRIILRAIAIVLAVLSAAVSGYNSYSYFILLRPSAVALGMAITLTGGGVLLPDLGILVWQGGRKGAGSLFMVVSAIAVAICMTTTLAAMYNTRTDRTGGDYEQRAIGDEAARQSLEARGEKGRLEAEIVQLNVLINSTQAKIDAIPGDETLSETSQALVGRLNRYLKSKGEYESRISGLDRILLEPRRVVPRRADFYSFLGGVLHVDPGTVEFYCGVVPAVFLELTAPLMAMAAIFL